MRTKWHPVLLLLLAAAACGRTDDGSPVGPAPAVTQLTISPATDLLKLKAAEKFAASARMSNGASETVAANWSSDSGAVTVDGAGLATAAAAGTATITARYQGHAATRTIRVVPDYAGRWAGSFLVTSCQVESGFRPEWCAPVVNAMFPARLEFVQTRDVLSGTWTLQDEATGTVQGTISTAGVLTLTGTAYQSGVAISISSWESETTDNATMTGRFTLTWTAAGGAARTQAELRSFTRQ